MKRVCSFAAVALVASISSVAFAGETKVTSLLAAGLDAIKHSQWESSAQYNSAALKMPGLTKAEEVVALNNLCIAMAYLPDTDKGVAVCDKAVEAAPERWSGYLNRGHLKLTLGASRGAYADFAQAKLLNPDQSLSDATTPLMGREPRSQFLALRPLTEGGIQQAEAK